MAKKKEKKREAAPPVRVEKERRIYFPKILLLFGIIVIFVGIVDLWDRYDIPREVLDVLLILAGLWLFKKGIEHGFRRRRKEILKKYI